ncbi:hypothetical protein [Photorhabdus temperata]|uniref:Uncharacterized protein n=1 Tax=Photorhabdus temperata J3 TaxID=1389415 RepID=U7QU39_PHOTE|nr:hypothetical protein [Photorhabdus temperata]EQB99390.1 hypothetical protein B738_17864 [Photorhabdus temperata subsp. temperata M1021]ERT11489.1 hypothetical protein O185_19450 [Photorhabdus temperata J3]
MAKEYNYIYEQLVDSDDDIHGIISYSVYKRQKIQFIKDLKQKHQRDPIDSDLQPFNELSMSPAQLEFYRSEATHILDIIKGAAGSLLFVLLTGVLYFSVWSLSTSPKMVVEQIFDVKIISVED